MASCRSQVLYPETDGRPTVNPTATIGRRNFVLSALALTTAGAGGAGLAATPRTARSRAVAANVPTSSAWILKTDSWTAPRGNPARTHCKCSACIGHGHNKIFSTLADADDPAQRAHVGCLCEPLEIQLPTSTWTGLFGSSAPSVDRRNPAVAAQLNPAVVTAPFLQGSGAPQATASPAAPGAAPSGSTTTLAGLAIPAIPGSGGPASGSNSSAGSPSAGTAITSPTASTVQRAASTSSAASDAWEWGLPAAGLVTGFAFLLWWRRRAEDEEDVPAL
jgi:hypothetical protein